METVRQLLLDTETTGFDPKDGHRIIEFAALEMIDRKPTGKALHLYFNPERDIPEAATKVHGITIEQVVNEPVFAKRVDEIIEFISGAELIIHNAKFDITFLDHHFIELGKSATSQYVSNVIDTLAIARSKFPGGKNSLDALCDRFNVDRSNRSYHGALIDCELLADVYLGLTSGQISLLGNDGRNGKPMVIEYKKIDSGKYNLAVPNVTEEEMHLHNDYLRQLDKTSKGKCEWFNRSKEFIDA